ncbi:MAG: YkgJ family cysteine cluster protein [Pirellulales bacterium]|nr:YkgJ family cysteine cluster protein [Pirellulales bacterium]
MQDPPWYHEGLRFECTGCGACCTGDEGYVWVNQPEIEAMAAALGIEPAEFERKFVRTIGTRRSLCERPDGDCMLFDRTTLGCRVYAVRPRQCGSWPFWASNVRAPSAWRQTCRDCPGAGQGPLVPLDEIERQRGIIQI